MFWGARRAVLGIAGMAMLLAACGMDQIESAIDAPLPAHLPPCEERYEEGKIIDYSAEGDFSKACTEGGDLVTPVPVSLQCSDNRLLVFNDYAWGFQGDEMTLFEPPGNVRTHDNEELQELSIECLRRDGGDSSQ